MLIASHHQLGESANELVAKFGNKAYRYGFPDFYAYGPPVRPMHWDASRIYQGVIGRHYPDAQTMRYHSLYDPNMYMQPGVPTGLGDAGGMTSQQAIAAFEDFLELASFFAAAHRNYEVTYASNNKIGLDTDPVNQLWVIGGKTFEAIRQATAAAGGIVKLNAPSTALKKRLDAARLSNPAIVVGTFGTVDDVLPAIENMIDALKSGQVTPIPVSPIATSASMATPRQFAIAGATVGAVALGVLGLVLLTR